MRVLKILCVIVTCCFAFPAAAQTTREHFALIKSLLDMQVRLPDGLTARQAERQQCFIVYGNAAGLCMQESEFQNSLHDQVVKSVEQAEHAPPEEQSRRLVEVLRLAERYRDTFYGWYKKYFPQQLEMLRGRRS